MRVALLSFATLLAFTVGCNKSPEGGAPGTNSSFKIDLPATPVPKDIKQDNQETFDGKIDRGSEFKKDVKLEVSKLDKIEVKLNKDTIKANEDGKFSITVKPAKDAPLAEHTITVTAKPDGGGEATSGTFKIKVTENK